MSLHHTLMLLGSTFAAFAAVYLVSPWLVEFCRRQGFVATITERSSHTRPTPHGGGIIFPALVVPLGLFLIWFWPLPFKGYLSVLLLGSLLVAYVSWLDDRHELTARARLLVHLIAVAIALFLLPRLFDFIPLWLEKTVLMLAWGWFVNLYNFMDGADGLSTTQAISMSLGLALLVPPLAPLALVVAAAAAGFLRVNWYPAKLFMGDIGSTWLGYILGGLYLVAAVDDTPHVIWPLATLALVFCADATTTLIRRIASGHKPWQPHKTFWFHRYLALGHKHARLARRVASLNLIMFAIAYISYNHGWPKLGFAAALLVMAAAACYIRHHEKRVS
jgi:UDP-N-acetylmuramyl pentapeptide phosphotransferase/UDP-N-acetylglucosamine-1-phosphate transferase